MNKKRIAQILTVLILLSNVNFQPNLIYADEVGNENVVSGSNLEEEEETGKEIELGTIDLDYYPNKYSQYSKRNYLSEAEKTVIKFGKEKLNKDFYISDALFENNKVCYKLIIKNALDDYFPYGNNDANSEYSKNNYRNYDFDKNDRNKYIVYINAPNNSAYFDPEDFSEHDYYNMNIDKIQNMIEKSLSQKFSNFNYNLKLNLEKQPEYKNGLKVVYASEGEDESGNVDGTLYKLYFKPLTLSKTLNEYIDETNAKPFFVSENEILENKISDENLNKINEILNNFNKNILFNVNLKIENKSIKKENISNNNIQYYINVKNEIDGTNKKLIISYNKEPELLETYNITEKINVNQNHNFNYYGFDFYQECVERMRRLTNEDNLIFNTLKFDKNKNLYYYDATKRLEGDSHSIDYQKLENLENRKKYRMYIDLHNFIYDNDFGDYNTIINYINNDILRTNYGFRNYYQKPFKTDNTKYKDGDYIYVILKDEYNKEYKLYTKQKELNEFIESNILISKEELENEEQNIDLNNLIVDDEVHYLQDIDSIINDPIFGYDTLRVKTIIDNGQKYNLISAENNLLPLSSFIYRKYPNEKIVNVDKKEKDNDIYLIFNLTNDKQYVLKLNKIIIPNIKLNIDNNYLSSQNQDDIKKTIKYFYKNQIENFQNFTLFKENGQTKVKVKFEYSNYQSNNFNKYLTVNVNNPDNETVELFDPSTIQDKQEHLYNINIKYNPNIDEINEEGFYDAGTVEIDKNLDARIYKEYEGASPSIGWDTDIQIIESLKQKLNITNKIIQKNWQDGYLKYDKDKQKFYQEYSILSTDDEDSNKNEKIYRFYFIGTNKDYEFSDENDTKLDLTDEKNIDVVLAFIKEEYENVKDIKLNNKNILTENDKNYLDVKITEDDGTERDAKIFLNPTTMNLTPSVPKNININITVSSEELSKMKLSKETINQINDTLNKKINNNILYKNEYFIINDYNIYKDEYSPIESYYVNLYNIKNKVNEKKHISIEDDLTADLLLENNDNTYELDINNFKVSEYKQCNKYNKNNIYLSKNGEIPILDYINSKLDNNSYADNLRLYKTSSYYKIMADVIDKNTHEKKTIFIIHCNKFDSKIKKSFFINNINDNLILTEKNKKDLKKLIKNTEDVNIKNIEFEEKFNKETLIFKNKTVNYYKVKATIYFENNYSEIKTYNIVIDSNYQDQDTVDILNNYLKPGLPSPTCPPSQPKYLSPPAYGGKTCSKDKKEVNIKIKIPSANDFPDITPCNPNKPNEDIPNPPTPNEIVPKEPNEIVPKEPSEDTPHTPTPSNLPKISSPSPKTSNPPTVTERTPIVIIKNTPNVNGETRDKENADINNSENTDGLPNIERTPVKTNDYLFSIISVFGMIGIFACFINLMKNKHRNKSI